MSTKADRQTNGRTDRWTDIQTDKPKTIELRQLVGGALINHSYFVAIQYFEYGVKQLGRHETANKNLFYISPFEIVNFPFLDGDVPRSTSYGVDISQLILFTRASSHVADFNTRNKL